MRGIRAYGPSLQELGAERESRREEERLREKKELGGGALKQEQRQNLP